jgi:hypothetical protein
MKKNKFQYRRDGFFNYIQPYDDDGSGSIGIAIDPIPNPLPYQIGDSVLDVDYNGLSCEQLAKLLSYCNQKIAEYNTGTVDAGKFLAYYQSKQTQLLSVINSVCQTGGTKPPVDTIIITPVATAIPTPAAGAAGGGSKTTDKKSFNWWLLAIPVAIYAMYKSGQ